MYCVPVRESLPSGLPVKAHTHGFFAATVRPAQHVHVWGLDSFSCPLDLTGTL